jgi:hypothetical protein
MARLVPLEPVLPGSRSTFFAGCVFTLGFLLSCGAVSAAPPLTNAPSGKPPTKPSTPAVATAKPPATNAAPVLPPGMQNTLSRYGNIVTPGDQAAYPLRLRLPSPNEAEVHIPKPDDLTKRAKLEALANLTDDEIRKQLAAWPAYNKMSLRDQAMMLVRIQDFRDYHVRFAMQKARDMGLSTLTPAQQAKFEKEYWDQRLKLDQDLAKQFQPIYQAREQTMNDQLFREFSSAMPAPAPAPPKPAPKPTKPAQPLALSAAATTNAAPMVGQAPR